MHRVNRYTLRGQGLDRNMNALDPHEMVCHRGRCEIQAQMIFTSVRKVHVFLLAWNTRVG